MSRRANPDVEALVNELAALNPDAAAALSMPCSRSAVARMNSLHITLPASRTKRASFGRLFTRPGDLVEAIDIAAARLSTQEQSEALWGILFDLAPEHNALVDVQLAKCFAEQVLGLPIEITITEQRLVGA